MQHPDLGSNRGKIGVKMMIKTQKISALALAAIVAASLGGCASGGALSATNNRSLDSVHQPIVSTDYLAIDLETRGGDLSATEMDKLRNWFDAVGLQYGDKVAIDDPSPYGNKAANAAVARLVGRYGMMMIGDAPITNTAVESGFVRVVITRARAEVPGCPNWDSKSATDFTSGTSSNYGCASNANLAAMVADPQDLVKGAKAKGTDPLQAGKAIDVYRKKEPTGKDGVPQTSTTK
jgi:pilus assembly protein CpaD